MNKHLVRIVTLLLVPCLFADPAMSFAFMESLSHPRRERVGVRGDIDQTPFNQEALMLTGETSWHPLHVVPASWFRRLLRKPAPPAAAQEDQKESRGYSGLENEIYSPLIKKPIEAGNFGAIAYVDEFGVGTKEYENVALRLDNGTEKTGDYPLNGELKVLRQAIHSLDKEDQDLLESGTLLFIPNLDRSIKHETGLESKDGNPITGAHYGLIRHQYYIDTKWLRENPALLAAQLHHEIQERHQVLMELERQGVRLAAGSRRKRVVIDLIRTTARKIHAILKGEEKLLNRPAAPLPNTSHGGGTIAADENAAQAAPEVTTERKLRSRLGSESQEFWEREASAGAIYSSLHVQDKIKAVLKNLDSKEKLGTLILDLGSGTQLPITRFLAEGGHKVLGIDASLSEKHPVLEISAKVMVAKGDIQNMDETLAQPSVRAFIGSKDDLFDAVILSGILNYVDWLQVMDDVQRHLKPGGRVIIAHTLDGALHQFHQKGLWADKNPIGTLKDRYGWNVERDKEIPALTDSWHDRRLIIISHKPFVPVDAPKESKGLTPIQRALTGKLNTPRAIRIRETSQALVMHHDPELRHLAETLTNYLRVKTRKTRWSMRRFAKRKGVSRERLSQLCMRAQAILQNPEILHWLKLKEGLVPRINARLKHFDITPEGLTAWTGLGPAVLKKILSGDTQNPTLPTLIALADGLMVNITWLLLGIGDPEPLEHEPGSFAKRFLKSLKFKELSNHHLIGLTGINAQLLEGYMHGTSLPPVKTLLWLAWALGVTPGYLAAGELIPAAPRRRDNQVNQAA